VIASKHQRDCVLNYIRDMDTLAKRLAWAREKKGMTQGQLAKAVKVSQSTIGNLEAGIRLTSRKVALIADVLEVDALWLAEGGARSPEKSDHTQHDAPAKQVAVNDTVHNVALERFQRIAYIYWQSDEAGQRRILRMADNVQKSSKKHTSGERQEVLGKLV
jgi:transcriptional regulator with XRE-family HTH domain